MADFFKSVLIYIKNNKDIMLPHVFTFVIFLTIMLISLLVNFPGSKSIIYWLYVPFFAIFAFRALAKTEKDDLPKKQASFVVFILPILLALVFLFFGMLIYLLGFLIYSLMKI